MLSIQANDWQTTKTMIETDVIPKDLNPRQVIIRLFRWYTFEEQILFNEAVKNIEQFLETHKIYYSDGYVAEVCSRFMENKKYYKPLRKLEVIELYESDVKIIQSLKKQDLRKTYFAMMIQCKARKVQGSETWNVMYDSIYEYVSYCNVGCPRNRANEILYYLQRKGLIDVPLFELNKMYYVAPEESGKVLYEIDTTKLDDKSLTEQFTKIFGSGKVIDETPIMVIDLKQPQGYVIKYGKQQVTDYLVGELGVAASKVNDSKINAILLHTKYRVDDFTLVKVLDENEEWLQRAEKLQRSLQPHERKLFTSICTMHLAHLYAMIYTLDLDNIPWKQIIKDVQEFNKQLENQGIKNITKDALKDLKKQAKQAKKKK